MDAFQQGIHGWIDKTPYIGLQNIHFSPRLRVGMQIAITAIYVGVMWVAYKSLDIAVKGTGSTGQKLPPDANPPAWIFLVFPVLAIIPAFYIFLFLKHNFLQ